VRCCWNDSGKANIWYISKVIPRPTWGVRGNVHRLLLKTDLRKILMKKEKGVCIYAEAYGHPLSTLARLKYIRF